MKRLFIVCLASFLFLTHCQKKEAPKDQTPFPAGHVASQDAIISLQESVRQNPKDLHAWIELGNMLMDTARFQNAINAYQKALELDQKNVNVRVDMGTCYRKLGKPDKAVEEYKKAIALNPGHLNAHRNLGVVLAFDLRNNKGAVQEFEEYLRLSPTAADAEQIKQLIAKLKASQ